MSSSAPNPKKRPLKFVSEGVTDLDTQKDREQVEQAKFEAECKRRERKSLREQLRANAINKQREFSGLVKERDGFNRLDDEELDYFNKVKEEELKKENDLKRYLEREASDFELKKSRLKAEEAQAVILDKTKVKSVVIGGIVKKKNKGKLNMKRKKLSLNSLTPRQPDDIKDP